MNPTIDLNILPLYYQNGQEQADSAEIYAVMPPKRPAHGREADSLILYLCMAGNAPLLPEQQNPLMERLAQKFYKTSGSVTAAMRSVAEGLNLHLLDRNLRISGAGKQGTGLFIIAVLRGDMLYLAHCGPVYSFLIKPAETQVMHDPSGAGRGLGLTKTVPVRFFQVNMQSEDYLVFSPRAPAGWTTNGLRYTPRLGIEGMRRHLLDQAGAELGAGTLRAALLQAQAGNGKLRLLHRKPGVPDMAHTSAESAPDTAPAEPAPGAPAPRQVVSSSGLRRVEAAQPVEKGAAPPAVPEALTASAPSAPQPATQAAAKTSSPAKERPVRPKPERRTLRQRLAPFLAATGAVGRAVGNTLESAGRSLGRVVRNLLPDEGLLHLPPSVMVFIALAIPLVIATIGGVIYIQRGKAAQHQLYYQQAVVAAKNASGQTEPPAQRAAWLLVLGALDSAEFYQVTPDSQALRTQAQTILDTLDKVERLNFQPALPAGTLDAKYVIRRVVAVGNDLYLLDALQGSVLRATISGQGYAVDTTFKCGPSYGALVVGPLVDITSIPAGFSEDATLLGIDASGNLLYCLPDGSQPSAVQLALPGNFKEAVNLEIDNGDLYVLDPQSKALWLYNNMQVDQLPRDFFGEDRPDNMADVIDMAINDDDLFLLHADGQLSHCVYSSLKESPTRCEEPYPYQDGRPGRVPGAIMEDTGMVEIYFTPPPGPSIYMLDAQQQAVFYFSRKLDMQVQYRPAAILPGGTASAFAVINSLTQRMVFLAVGNQVYYAALP